MDKAYTPADIEARIYARWEAAGYFAPSGKGPAFSIVIPPPNVTGTLHMGHALQDTIMDALLRRLVAAGNRSCGQCHADGGRTPAECRRSEPHRSGTRGVRRAGLAVEGNLRRHARET